MILDDLYSSSLGKINPQSLRKCSTNCGLSSANIVPFGYMAGFITAFIGFSYRIQKRFVIILLRIVDHLMIVQILAIV